MQTSQPKPCPFCGKADDLSRNPFMGDVVCDACGASVDEDSWNNRPTEDALREALQGMVRYVGIPTVLQDRPEFKAARAALNRANTGDQQ